MKEPYHVAGGWQGLEQVPRPDDPVGIIEKARNQQANSARRRLGALKIAYVAQDEKSILASVGEILGLKPADCDTMMKPLKPASARSWRKEERLIALGAWLNREYV